MLPIHFSASHPPPILAVGHSENGHFLPAMLQNYDKFTNFRAIKKQFREGKPAAIVICIESEEDEELGKKVTQYVREGLSNMDTRIVLLRSPVFELDEVSWMEDHQVNACLVTAEDRLLFNTTALNRELDTFSYIDSNQRQHDAETDMLMCITQFSREKESIAELLKKFSQTLSVLCYSSCSFHLKIKDNTHCEINYCDHEDSQLTDTFSSISGLPAVPDYLQHAFDEKHPQIDLIPEKTDLTDIESSLGVEIGSYLTFPIVAYNNVLYLLLYLIPESHMDKVSMKQINVINKASEQLTILLERRQAETSLKKQYQRLKGALVELKSTKQELVHKEKMASIGQMAAGIAHEINNPLSYVMSNFSSMDNYLKSIMQLQDLQSDFLLSIDESQNEKAKQLKQNISEFEEEADIPFILEDIRAVVSDSYTGLQRVRNIITDLKSFTYSQSTELEVCDLQKVVNETLQILKHNINDDITIKQSLENIPQFMAHNGLMGQVFTNLIKNAIQAMQEAQTPDPLITIKASQQNDQINISVRDNGPGLPEGKKDKVFDPFFTTKTVGEGTGLGLSVTFNIIKKLGGTINCDSEKGQFTEFIIRFPVNH